MSEALLIAKLNLIASKIAHEDNLIGQRTTWLVMSQSFLLELLRRWLWRRIVRARQDPWQRYCAS